MVMQKRQLFTGSLVGIAEFAHPVADDTWSRTMSIGDVSLVVFPRFPVMIKHEVAGLVLATPNTAMLYNAGDRYSRDPRDASGDQYLEFQLKPAAMAELAQEIQVLKDGRFSVSYTPIDSAIYFHQHLLARHLQSPGADSLLVEETSLRIVSRVLSAAGQHKASPRHSTPAHQRLAEAAKEILVESISAPLTLTEIANRLGPSPFHLARVFRKETGFSLHDYRLQVRLRSALQRLDESAGSLSALALELGFASHSHFSVAFQRTFGLPPSRVRNSGEARRVLETARALAALKRTNSSPAQVPDAFAE